MGSDAQGTTAERLAAAACSELWAVNHLSGAALARLQTGAEVSEAQLACVRQSAGALIAAITPVVRNRALVEHVVRVAHELHRP